jgi:hypothetical protein
MNKQIKTITFLNGAAGFTPINVIITIHDCCVASGSFNQNLYWTRTFCDPKLFNFTY